MLGLNVARYILNIRMSGFTTFLGLIAILSSILELAGLDMIEREGFLIVFRGYLLFGKVEQI